MSGRVRSTALAASAGVVFLAAFVAPAVWLLIQCLEDGTAPEGGFTLSSRQVGLLLRSLWMAGVGTLVALVLSLPVAVLFDTSRRSFGMAIVLALSGAVLVTPPFVYSFGWERICPAFIGPNARCIGVWALWAWPVAAMMIGSGWSRMGRSAYEAALLSTSATTAFFRVGLPAIGRHVALAGLVLFVVFFNDYGVPHGCGLITYSVELLSWAGSSSQAIDTVWPAIPAVMVTLGLIYTISRWVDWRGSGGEASTIEGSRTHRRAAQVMTVIVLVGVSWCVPLGALVGESSGVSVFVEAFRMYWRDLVYSVGVALGAGVLSLMVGVGLFSTGAIGSWWRDGLRGIAPAGARGSGVVVWWVLAFGLLPAALIGRGLVAAYNQAATAWVYDHWPILVLAYLARFGWIGVLAALVMRRQVPPDLIRQARVDGASEWAILTGIQLRWHWPTAVAGAAIVASQSLAEVAASTLVRVPTFSPIAHVLMEKFHRFETGMLISLSLWLVAFSIPGALFAAALVCRRRGY